MTENELMLEKIITSYEPSRYTMKEIVETFVAFYARCGVFATRKKLIQHTSQAVLGMPNPGNSPVGSPNCRKYNSIKATVDDIIREKIEIGYFKKVKRGVYLINKKKR